MVEGCRFHGRKWSKTCQECLAHLDHDQGPATIQNLVGHQYARDTRLWERVTVAGMACGGLFLMLVGAAWTVAWLYQHHP